STATAHTHAALRRLALFLLPSYEANLCRCPRHRSARRCHPTLPTQVDQARHLPQAARQADPGPPRSRQPPPHPGREDSLQPSR
ncbi:hypothetical protein BN1723_019444, partial [Verticillium longisporum]